MKTTLLSILIVSIILSFAACSFAEEGVLKVAMVSGPVYIKSEGADTWIDAKVGQALKVQDSVNTKADATATLEFPDKSSIALKANTTITVEKLLLEKASKTVGIAMSLGTIRVIIKKGGASDFTVKTPTAICGARGTIFFLNSTETSTTAYTEQGMIDFTNAASGENYSITEGNGSTANSDGTTTPPAPMSAAGLGNMTSGFDQPVAEPYRAPENAGDNTPPDTILENDASSK